ncbi:MAG: hypothetical protein WAW39_20460 [Prosthecobacter sp.]
MNDEQLRRQIASNLPKSFDPLLGLITVRLKRGPTSIMLLFIVLWAVLISTSPLVLGFTSYVGVMKSLAQYSTLLIGYPLFIINVGIATYYYKGMPDAISDMLSSRFIQIVDKKQFASTIDRYFGLLKRIRLWKNIAIYAVALALVGSFHVSYSLDQNESFFRAAGGNRLSTCGYLNSIYMTLIISIALQFICNHGFISLLLSRLRELSRHGHIRATVCRSRFHSSITPLIGLSWWACATVVPLFIFSGLQVLVTHAVVQPFIVYVQMAVFFPAVYVIIAPRVLIGHFVPIMGMLNDSKSALIDAVIKDDIDIILATLKPALTSETTVKEGDPVAVREKVLTKINEIKVSPIGFKMSFIVPLPLVLDIAVKTLLLPPK